MDKKIALSIIVSALILSGALLYKGSERRRAITPPAPAVAMVSGDRQIIEITARGGYTPRLIKAKAGLTTVIRIKTQNTYDCSAALVLPKLNYQKFLEANGVEEITLQPEQAQGSFNGLCSMGMYSFRVDFE
jgi:P-type Cu+ transporter